MLEYIVSVLGTMYPGEKESRASLTQEKTKSTCTVRTEDEKVVEGDVGQWVRVCVAEIGSCKKKSRDFS